MCAWGQGIAGGSVHRAGVDGAELPMATDNGKLSRQTNMLFLMTFNLKLLVRSFARGSSQELHVHDRVFQGGLLGRAAGLEQSHLFSRSLADLLSCA